MSDDIRQIVDEIRYHHRNRVFAMETRKGVNLRLGWFLKTQLGWSKLLPEAERNVIAAKAELLAKTGKKMVARQDGKKVKPFEVPEGFDDLSDVIVATVRARAPFDGIEKTAVKAMEDLAKQLPVWAWGKDVRGFGAGSLATVVAETGLVSCDKHAPPENGNYPGPAKLWKRMGLAVMGDVRQGGLKKSASKEQWIEHGYSRKRRSYMWNCGQSLVKQNGDGPYRALYLERLRYEHRAAVAHCLIPATTTKQTVESWAARGLPVLEQVKEIDLTKHRSAGHMDRRAQRYMEKRLLKHLWQAWREASAAMISKPALPPAEDSDSCGHATSDTHPSIAAGGAGHGVGDTQRSAARAASSPR